MTMNEEKTHVPEMDELASQLKRVTDGEEALNTIRDKWWNGLVLSVLNYHGSVSEYFREFERKYKNLTGHKKMPSSYRSAKSVIKSAVNNEVRLINDEGEPNGKTAIESEIKEAKSQKKQEKSTFDKVNDSLHFIETNLNYLNPDERDDALRRMDSICRDWEWED